MWDKIHVEQLCFSFMVTYSTFVLWRFGGWFKINKQTHKRPHEFISYAVMRVNLAAQALIDPVGNVSNRFGPEEAEGTGQFFIMDKLIECLKCKGTYLKNHSYNHMNQLMILDLHG